MTLHGYFRSSASWRVRIALNLKGLSYEGVFHHLRRGEQRDPAYLLLNPQGLVPALVLDDGTVLTQSLAIIEYLDELFPKPALLPEDLKARAKVRAIAFAVATDIHPLQNLRVLRQLELRGDKDSASWARIFNESGLKALDILVRDTPGPFCFGSAPTLADICLAPQLFGARRFGVDVTAWPRLLQIEESCRALDAFGRAEPERQPDAE
jgi:maleylpyruvate isomerase